MSTSTYSSFSTKVTPQSEAIPGSKQVPNNAGGFSYQLDKWGQFGRFLILGSEKGSYYVGEKKLTKDNAINVIACIEEDGERAVKEIIRISDEGLAPKNDPAIFALALAASAKDVKTRQFALDNLGKVCRIPTHLMHFVDYCKGLRGWGSSLKNGIQLWYNEQGVEKLAYQLVKYQQRDQWSNRDILRKAHPKSKDASPTRNNIYKWVVDGYQDIWHQGDAVPQIITAFEDLKQEFSKENGQPNLNVALDAIRKYNMSREMLPTELLKEPLIWEALLEKMPYTAMLRNLGNMSKVGLLKPLSSAAITIEERLLNEEMIRKARIHPIAILLALKTYASGRGLKGSGTWTVVPKITDALNEAFYKAFKFVEPTGKNFLIGVDVSGSMSSQCGGTPLTCAEGAAAMALSIARVEPNVYVHGFTSGYGGGWSSWGLSSNQSIDGFVDLGITPSMCLDDVLRITRSKNYGATDCALPMLYALHNKIDVDCFVTITDSESWAGQIHASQAIRMYREKTGRQARNIVVAMTATNRTVNDPDDVLGLDINGFDSSVPQLVSTFARG